MIAFSRQSEYLSSYDVYGKHRHLLAYDPASRQAHPASAGAQNQHLEQARTDVAGDGEGPVEVPEAWYRSEFVTRVTSSASSRTAARAWGSPIRSSRFTTASPEPPRALTRGTNTSTLPVTTIWGLSGHLSVSQAAKDAIDRYGTSGVSQPIGLANTSTVHQQLEEALARSYGVADAVVFVSGHATNVSTIGYLFGPRI